MAKKEFEKIRVKARKFKELEFRLRMRKITRRKKKEDDKGGG